MCMICFLRGLRMRVLIFGCFYLLCDNIYFFGELFLFVIVLLYKFYIIVLYFSIVIVFRVLLLINLIDDVFVDFLFVVMKVFVLFI